MSEEELASWTVLNEGITDWMRPQFMHWLQDMVTGTRMRNSPDRAVLLDIQNACRVNLGVTNGSDVLTSRFVMGRFNELEDRLLLRIADYLVRDAVVARSKTLGQILANGRSRYTVGVPAVGKRGLIERVPTGVQDAAEAIMARSGTAGQLLREAWAYAHQFEASPSDAYVRAVKALEAVSVTKVVPNQREPHLGHVLGQLRKDGDWRLPLREPERAPSADLVVGMVETLWRGNRDRHGAPDYTHATLEEARTAVDLAVTLVDWFAADLVKRRPIVDGP